MRLLAPVLALALASGAALAQTTPAAPATGTPPATTQGTKPATTKPRIPFETRFDNANTTHDGKLTLDQAKAAKMRGVVKHFTAIDKDKKGYITKADVEAFRKADAKKGGEL